MTRTNLETGVGRAVPYLPIGTFGLLFGVACVLALVPLWTVTFLPMVDLPQHAAQLAIGDAWSDGGWYREHLRPNPLSPLVLVYGLTGLLAHFLSIPTALTVVVSLSVVGFPLATLWMLQCTGGDRWWSFAAFPVVFGYAFYWGFLNYFVMMPIALIFFTVGLAYVRHATRVRGATLALGIVALFFGHVLVCAYVGLVLGTMVLASSRTASQAMRRALPLLLPLPLLAGWFLAARQLDASSSVLPNRFDLGIDRLLQLPGLLAGLPTDATAPWMGVALVAGVALVGARPSREWVRWAPFVVTALVYAFAPVHVFGVGLIYPRFAAFLLPTALFALDGRDHAHRSLGVAALVGLSLLWVAALTPRFQAFDREQEGLQHVLAAMEPNQRVLSLVLSNQSQAIGYPTFLHFPTWYQVEKGGMVDFSFAEFMSNRFRYAEGHAPNLPAGFEWRPLAFDWSRHAEVYTYFVARAHRNPTALVFREHRDRVEVVAERGSWWLYRKRAAEAPDPAAAARDSVPRRSQGDEDPD